jgi:hypothetical protein
MILFALLFGFVPFLANAQNEKCVIELENYRNAVQSMNHFLQNNSETAQQDITNAMFQNVVKASRGQTDSSDRVTTDQVFASRVQSRLDILNTQKNLAKETYDLCKSE